MTTENYLVVQNNVVTNCVVWDGNTETWQPPADATMLVQSTTLAAVWVFNELVTPPFELQEIMGAGAIGFSWNGTICITDQPQPETPIN
jgi:hypothetical protein